MHFDKYTLYAYFSFTESHTYVGAMTEGDLVFYSQRVRVKRVDARMQLDQKQWTGLLSQKFWLTRQLQHTYKKRSSNLVGVELLGNLPYY